jgi:hypothetical protein
MKRFSTLSLLALLLGATTHAQQLPWSAPIEVSNSGSYGFTRPRITVCNDVPVAVWGNSSTNKIYASRVVSGSFTTPVQVTPGDFQAFVFDWTAQEVDAAGDTLFVLFSDVNSTHAYVVRSLDGGQTFGDTARVDNMGTDVPRFPSVRVLPGGNPAVMYMRFDSNFDNPRYSVTRSTDGGATFQPDVNATTVVPGEPCDCCPGSLTSHGNRMAVLYRNNDGNIRDSWASLSLNGGASFDNGVRMDSSNWMLMSCPSSGPSGYIYGDTLVTTFMNGNGGAKVYVSALDLNTMQPTSRKNVTLTTGQQNYPRIAGVSDTLGVVWQQKLGTPIKIVFTASFNGINGVGNVLDTLSKNLSGNQSDPDIAYGGHKLHVVFTDEAGKVYYTAADLPQNPTDVQPVPPSGNTLTATVYGNTILIKALNDLTGVCSLRIFDATGRRVLERQVSGFELESGVACDAGLIPKGVYMVTLANGDDYLFERVALTR